MRRLDQTPPEVPQHVWEALLKRSFKCPITQACLTMWEAERWTTVEMLGHMAVELGEAKDSYLALCLEAEMQRSFQIPVVIHPSIVAGTKS